MIALAALQHIGMRPVLGSRWNEEALCFDSITGQKSLVFLVLDQLVRWLADIKLLFSAA